MQERTGLLLDPYFSGTKMRWLLDNVPAVRAAADAGRLAFGTVESWLVYKLTGGRAHHRCQQRQPHAAAGAGRTRSCDEGLCDLFGVPLAALPGRGRHAPGRSP